MQALTDTRPEQTLAQVLRKRVEHCGDKPWLLVDDRAFSYREIDRRSNRLVKFLQRLEIGFGDTVLLMLPDTADFVVTWCALAKLGAIEVPVNIHLRGGVLAYVINDSLAATLIIDRKYIDRIETIAHELKSLKRIVLYSENADGTEPGLPDSLRNLYQELRFEDHFADVEAVIDPGPTYTDLMAVMYTSGTTGPSKGVMITQAHAYEYALSVVELLELRSNDVYYAPLPLFHIAGQWAVVYACCIRSATAVLAGTFGLGKFWDEVNQYHATCTFLLGAMANFLYQQPETPQDTDNTLERALVVPLLPETEQFKQRFDCLVSATWGSTEVNVPMRSGFVLPNSRTCGRVATDRYEVRIVDKDDNELPPNVPGEAVVRAKEPWILMAGYWNHPKWTVSAWRNLWLHSGDMLMRDEQGNFYFVDRIKDAIRRRGENISSMEVENEINLHSSVLECAVIPVDSTHTEQEVMAVVVLRDDERLDPLELTKFLEPRMAYFMVPRYIDIVEALPKTQTGKIQKYKLRENGITPTTWDREAAGYKLKK